MRLNSVSLIRIKETKKGKKTSLMRVYRILFLFSRCMCPQNENIVASNIIANKKQLVPNTFYYHAEYHVDSIINCPCVHAVATILTYLVFKSISKIELD